MRSDDRDNAGLTGDGRHERDPSAANRHPSRHRPVSLSRRRIRPRVISTQEMLDSNRIEIRRLYETGKIQVINGREHFAPGVKEESDRLWKRRWALQAKLGPARLLSGLGYHIQVSGMDYSFSPYFAWLREFAAAYNSSLPTPLGPRSTRDRVIWLLWHFRRKALLQAGQTPHKVRGPLVRCGQCGFRHRYIDRPMDDKGVRSCRRCGSHQHQDISGSPKLTPLPRITKTFFRQRFRISPRRLERILAVPPPPPIVGAIPLF